MYPVFSKEGSKIETIRLSKGEEYTPQFGCTVLCFIFSGAIDITSKNIHNKRISKEEILLIPFHTPCQMYAKEDTTILKIKVLQNIFVNEKMPFMHLLEGYGVIKGSLDFGTLTPNQRITDFVYILKNYSENELNCDSLFEAHISVILHMISAFYSKREVTEFFSPIYSSDFEFSIKIYENIDKVKNVKELAKLINYSASGFEKRFKKIYNTSPYEWLMEHKSKKIYHEIITTKKTFSELAYEYDFSSPAHFNNFCLKHFKTTPGQLRKKIQEQVVQISKTKLHFFYVLYDCFPKVYEDFCFLNIC